MDHLLSIPLLIVIFFVIQTGYRLAEPLSLVAGSKYGVFLVRNDAWARDYLDRFATALEARPLLCATLTSVW